MGKRVLTTYFCDLCGDELEVAIRREVGSEGTLYVLELCGVHDKEVRDFFERVSLSFTEKMPYTAYKNKVTLPTAGPPEKKKDDRSAAERRAIREWGVAKGLLNGMRGMIPAHVLKAYDDAHLGQWTSTRTAAVTTITLPPTPTPVMTPPTLSPITGKERLVNAKTKRLATVNGAH